MFVDTHTHLFSSEFDEDRDRIVTKAINAGVELLFLPNIDASTIEPLRSLMTNYPKNCFGMMGLHPSHVKDDFEQQLQLIKAELYQNSDQYIAVGEIGMDLYWDKTFIEQQREAFARQINWAKELSKPVVIHAREAFDELFMLLDELNDDRLFGVFHCFTGTQEQAKRIEEYGGFKLGIGGVVTYKNSGLDKVLETLSLDRIILETDSPYLAPVPMRGQRNESAFLMHVAEKLADIYQISIKQVEQITTKNALELFNFADKSIACTKQ